MISILFAFKIVVLILLLGVSGISYFHIRETARMEQRLGILLPQPVRALAKTHVALGFIVLLLLFFLFLL